METIDAFDKYLFQLINVDGQNIVSDFIAPVWREKMTWLPLYLLLLVLAIKRYKKKVLYFLLGVITLIIISDTLSSKIIKPFFERLRPCHFFDEEHINLIINCSNGFSFTSSHATNHMAVATFISIALFKNQTLKYALIIWAVLVGYAQIYVGVHYPGDVLAGLLLGALIGAFVGYIVMNKTPLKHI